MMNKLAVFTLCLSGMTAINLANAGSVAGTGGATEITQIANNMQLVGMTAKQATQVSEAIATRIASVNQYVAMLQNLKNLPAVAMQQALAPYKEQVGDLGKLFNSVDKLKKAAENTEYLMSSRVTDARMLNMSMKEYLQREAKLANTKGGIYKSRYQQDIKAIAEMQARARELRTLSEKNQSISGNVEGLQQLNQHASITAGELMEIRAALLAQNVDSAQEKEIQQRATQAHAEDMSKTLDKARNRAKAHKEVNVDFKDPWNQNWVGSGEGR